MFPSPENGVSFKPDPEKLNLKIYNKEFPSPENGVSFKLLQKEQLTEL